MIGNDVKNMKRVTVTTPSRLHFVVIDLNGSLGRVDGGLGLSLEHPCFTIIAEPSKDVSIVGVACEPFRARAKQIIARLQNQYPFDGVRIEIAQSIPAHTGLGSGTQLSLGIAKAIFTLYDIDMAIEETALLVGRGGTSGIGVAAFRHGGFIIDGGHRFPEQKQSFLPSSASKNVAPPPVLFRCDFPDWPVLIVIPHCNPKKEGFGHTSNSLGVVRHISGDEETRLFTTLCPMPVSTVQKLSHLILMKVMPALLERDLVSFGSAINDIQDIGWKKVEVDAQGPILRQIMEFLRNNGAVGVGLSSWGPALYAFSENAEALQQKTQDFLENLPEGGTCFLTHANNIGAKVSES